MLDGKADNIRIEDPGVTKAESVISHAGRRELHQAKRSHPDGKWSLASLAGSDGRLLQAVHVQLTGNDDRFVFVSSSDARELAELAERSRQAESLQEFEEKFLAAKEAKDRFEKLQKHWNNANIATAFDILRRVEVRAMDEQGIEENVTWGLRALFVSDPISVCKELRTLAEDSVHKTLTRDDLISYLAARGHHLRRLRKPEAASALVHEVTEQYLAGVRKKLILKTLIPREATQLLLSQMAGDTEGGDFVLTGKAGTGKTACVIEFVDTLRNQGTPVLAFRLDHRSPASSTLELGGQLGLEESPALVLAAAAGGPGRLRRSKNSTRSRRRSRSWNASSVVSDRTSSGSRTRSWRSGTPCSSRWSNDWSNALKRKRSSPSAGLWSSGQDIEKAEQRTRHAMSQKYEKLKTLLKELFQLDQPDLDFGLYRIMHAKSAEVTQFLDKDLLPQVKEALGLYRTADKAELEKELVKAIEQAQALGADPATLPKVKDLRQQLADEAVDVGALENEVYNHLFSFFRRYYSEGDFLAKRVYKPGVYAIPYEGEEVKLHWANRDQYYIKTSEYLRDYAFRLRPDDDKKPMRVHFRLVDAAEGEHGNVKAAEGKDRVFILAAGNFIAEENGQLSLRFEYRPSTLTDWPEDARDGKTRPPVQKDLIALATRRVLALADASFAAWIAELEKPHVTASGEKADYTRLEAHLRRYTARNTFDYFIHKDLGGFLRRELDFYIKNEVMHLDDVEHETAPRVEQYLSKIKVIRRIAGKIIDFLAQLEDFQKKLWLKKKFVVETHYCITLDRIPEEFYPEIAANDAQREEWVRLFAIDEITADLTTPGYRVPLEVDFLKAQPYLVLDTKFFADDWTAQLVDRIESFEEQQEGLLIHVDNFDALNLLAHRYAREVSVAFIDPPYNTGVDGFPYKDSYQHASWLVQHGGNPSPPLTPPCSGGEPAPPLGKGRLGGVKDLRRRVLAMAQDRLELARALLSDRGRLFSTIDFVEVSRLRLLMDMVFGEANFLADIAWEKRYTRSNNAKRFYSLKDTVLAYRASEAVDMIREARSEKSKSNYTNPDDDPRWPWISSSYVNPATKEDRPNLVYEIEHPHTGARVLHPTHVWKYDPDTHQRHVEERRPYWGPDGSYEYPRLKSFLSEASDGMVPIDVWHYKDTGTTDDGGKAIKALFGFEAFTNPKPPSLIRRSIALSPVEPDKRLIIDFFAGSASTGEAVLQENREAEVRSKYVLVEIGEHFDTVMLPRICKVAYAANWRDGKPRSRDEGLSHLAKYIRLESYEDALNNLETRRTDTQRTLLDAAESQGADGFREQYLLRYMLDVETRGSQSLLNVQAFKDPTAYKLKVKRPGSDESREVNVDLLETFNYLIGLTVQHIAAPQTFTAEFERDSEKRLRLKGRLKQDAAGPWWFRTITGTTPDGRRTLVIWRKLTGDPEQDNLVLDEWFSTQDYSTRDYEFQLIYVNGGNSLENLKAPDDTWKVRLIEEDFHRLMFDTDGV